MKSLFVTHTAPVSVGQPRLGCDQMSGEVCPTATMLILRMRCVEDTIVDGRGRYVIKVGKEMMSEGRAIGGASFPLQVVSLLLQIV